MIDLAPHPQGVVLAIRAQPGAKDNAIRGLHGGALKVAVTQIAEKGKANEAVVKTLATLLGLSRSQVELVSGTSSRQKKVLIRGISAEELRQRLEETLKT
jgi:uncharacterized protein (TIGR00251 family)